MKCNKFSRKNYLHLFFRSLSFHFADRSLSHTFPCYWIHAILSSDTSTEHKSMKTALSWQLDFYADHQL